MYCVTVALCSCTSLKKERAENLERSSSVHPRLTIMPSPMLPPFSSITRTWEKHPKGVGHGAEREEGQEENFWNTRPQKKHGQSREEVMRD